jgi:putative GTP pyrophosphokinase
MAQEISKTQIDRLGERLKKDSSAESDLRLLEQYRHSFDNAYEIVRKAIREQLSLEATGRRKTTQSIVDKLRRESIRLTQIQDIAGCRLIAADIADQDQIVTSLSNFFENVIIVDRREKPSHGYRAVHVIVQTQEKLVEIQVRTELQHLWAELSEKYSDNFGYAIKYGGGDEKIQVFLTEMSSIISDEEYLEPKLIKWVELKKSASNENNENLVALIDNLEETVFSRRQQLLNILRDRVKNLENIKR